MRIIRALAVVVLVCAAVLGLSVDSAVACTCSGELLTVYADEAEVLFRGRQVDPIEDDRDEGVDNGEPAPLPERNWTAIALGGMAIGVVAGVLIGRRRASSK